MLNLRATNHPEFDAWRWNDYWVPLDVVIEFKRGVYESALTELARYLPRPARGRWPHRHHSIQARERARVAAGSLPPDSTFESAPMPLHPTHGGSK